MTYRTKKVAAAAASIAIAVALTVPAVTFAQVNTAPPTLDESSLGLTNIEEGGLLLGGGDVRGTVARLINVALGFLGIIAVIIVLIGGFKYMLSGGQEEKTAEARKLIVAGIIGLAIILSAWAITTFVVGSLVNATGTNP